MLVERLIASVQYWIKEKKCYTAAETSYTIDKVGKGGLHEVYALCKCERGNVGKFDKNVSLFVT